MKAQEFAAKLRAVAEWFEAHPDAPAPSILRFDVFVYERAEFAAVARAIGTAKKGEAGSWLYLRVEPTEDAVIDFNAPRAEVCERRVVGTRVIPAKVVEERIEEIVEWDCRPILGEGGDA